MSIDINLQKDIEEILGQEVLNAKKEPNTKYYDHSFVIIEDPNTGEILAMAGKKAILENGEYKIDDYTPAILTSPMTPGSVVKAASMLVGYNEGAIKIGHSLKKNTILRYLQVKGADKTQSRKQESQKIVQKTQLEVKDKTL